MTPARYTWSGGSEAVLRFGPDTGPVVIAALPLFEEANRTRAFVVTTLRALALRGVAGMLIDLPGTGDSLIPTHDATLAAMRDAYRAAAALESGRVYAFGIRSAALLDTLAALAGRYHLSPQTGAALLRELKRIGQTDRTPAVGDGWMVAGNLVSSHLLAELTDAVPAGDGVRTARLATDPQPAAIKVDAAPLWRRAEPDNDPDLAALIADDIAQWIATCAA